MEKYIDLEILGWVEIEGVEQAEINIADFQKEDIENLMWLAKEKRMVVEVKENIIKFID